MNASLQYIATDIPPGVTIAEFRRRRVRRRLWLIDRFRALFH